MNFLSSLFLLCCIYHLGHGVGLHGFHFHGLEEPHSLNKAIQENITEAWIQQPLDHFNPRDNRTWSMVYSIYRMKSRFEQTILPVFLHFVFRQRYLENSRFFKENGPILIMIGGEWAISRGFLEAGLMYELASKYNASMYYTEHRYYGKSKPTKYEYCLYPRKRYTFATINQTKSNKNLIQILESRI